MARTRVSSAGWSKPSPTSRPVASRIRGESGGSKVSWHENVDGGDLSFWTALIRRSLLENRGIKSKGIREIKLGDGELSTIVDGIWEVDGRAYTYMVATAVSGKKVFTYEVWGNASVVGEKLFDLESSVKTMKIRSFWQRLF